MNIAVAVKVVPDDQDILVSHDKTLDYSKAHQIISEYDLNAIEAATRLAEAEGSHLYAISASSAMADDLKVKKSILSRGPEELFMIADNKMSLADSRTTAQALAKLITNIDGGIDLIVCGDGSADMYAGQVGVQLSALLGIPVINKVNFLQIDNNRLIAKRTLEEEEEELAIELPAVVCVSPDIALPRIAGMREILAAGKKPTTIFDGDSMSIADSRSTEVTSIIAPDLTPRRQKMFDMKEASEFQNFISAVATAIH